jgi:DNA primase
LIAQHNYNIVDNLKSVIPIEDVLRQYLSVEELKRRGNKLVGRCPFHGEKTPSFHVWVDQNRFHCFGCGVSGDQLDLIARATGTSLAHTVKMLANQYGMLNQPLDIKKRKEFALHIKEAQKERQARDALRAELDKLYLRLTRIENSCREQLQSYDDYEKYPEIIDLLPILRWLIDEYLTFDQERQIAAWRFVKRGELSWMLKY